MKKKYEIDEETVKTLKFIIFHGEDIAIPLKKGLIEYLNNLKEIKE